MKMGSLSADAKDFVPLRFHKSQLTANVPEFIPRSNQNESRTSNNGINRTSWRSKSQGTLQDNKKSDTFNTKVLKPIYSNEHKKEDSRRNRRRLLKSIDNNEMPAQNRESFSKQGFQTQNDTQPIPLWSAIVKTAPISSQTSISSQQKISKNNPNKTNSSEHIIFEKHSHKVIKSKDKKNHTQLSKTETQDQTRVEPKQNQHVKKKLTRSLGNAPFTSRGKTNTHSLALYTAASEAMNNMRKNDNAITSYKQPTKNSTELYRVGKQTTRKKDVKSSSKMSLADYLKKDESDGKSAVPMSYSAVLRQKSVLKQPEARNTRAVDEFDFAQNLSLEERIRLKKKKKAEKRKMKIKMKKAEHKMLSGDQSQQNRVSMEQAPIKQSEKDIKLDMSNLFDQLLAAKPKISQNAYKKKIVVSTGVVSVVSGLAKKNAPNGKRLSKNKSGNIPVIMDGPTAIRKRGKERETPKRKKPTLMKKVINAEKERRRKLREKENISNNENVDISEKCTSEIEQPNENNILLETINEPPIPSETLDHQMVVKTEIKDGTSSEMKDETEKELPYKPLTHLPEEVWKKIHSRKFREYCDHLLSKEINHSTITLLTTLQRFQDRVYHETPLKFKQKRRFVLGLREVLKNVKLKKIKAVIIAPNMERIQSQGGIDNYLSNILFLCEEQNISKIFAMNRHTLGKVLKKKAPVSIVGIFSYDGAQDTYKEVIQLVEAARTQYMEKVSETLVKLTESEETQYGSNNISIQETFMQIPTTTTTYPFVYDEHSNMLPIISYTPRYYSERTTYNEQYEENMIREKILSSLKS